MQKSKSILLNIIFFLQALLIFLLLIENRVELPLWLQIAGRLHPVILHLPIGFLVLFCVLLLARNEFKKKAFNKISQLVLLLTSISASLTALLGFFLSRQGDYGQDALEQHKFSGVMLSMLCYFLVLVFDREENTKMLLSVLSVTTIVALLFVGHTGGTLTHGENYVFAPLKNPNEISVEASVFQKAVYPILERKCVSCHNEAKAKGKLVMTSVDKLKKGGKKGEEWVAGNPADSRMIKYIHLPLEDDNHMPPDGKPQLTKQEIAVLEMWIKSGADFETKFADLKESDSLKIIATANAPIREQSEHEAFDFKAASDEVINKLNTPFRSVFPLYQNGPALQADFFIRESFQPTALAELKDVKEQLVVLNLSKMPVIDSDLLIIAEFKNLEKINLNFSRINGDGLKSLLSLQKLSSLSLAGTEVTAEKLKPVLQLPNLREMFVWNTKISEEEKSKLASLYPKVVIATSQFKDERVLKLSRPVFVNEGILKKTDLVTLKHAMPGVVIRYTLDGTKPDSVSSRVYDKPFQQSTAFKIKAIACKDGWYCSDVFEQTYFVEGLKAEHAELLLPADKQYPGEGAKSLTDGRKGFTDVLKEPSWLGFRDNPFEAQFDFGARPPTVHNIVLSYAENLGGYIFPPIEVEVWGGVNNKKLNLIKLIKPPVPKDYSPQRNEALDLSFEVPVHYSIYKIVARPIAKLPSWHSGKGKKGWFFVDEVFFY